MRPSGFLMVFLDSSGKYHLLTTKSHVVCGMSPDHVWVFGTPQTPEELEVYNTVFPVAASRKNCLTLINTNDFRKGYC